MIRKFCVFLLAVLVAAVLAGPVAAAEKAAKKAKKAKKSPRSEAVEAGRSRVVNAEARQAGNQVVFTYDLEGVGGEVVMTVTVEGRAYRGSQLHLSGDVGRVGAGRGKWIAWNVLMDFPKGYGGDVEWEIKAVGEDLPGPPAVSAAGPSPAGPPDAGGSFTSPTLGAKFVLIPAGTFMMGSPGNEPGRDNDETQHQVTISRPFYMQTTEVTQGQWKRVMGNNPSHFRNCGDDCPVEQVSWNDVQNFIRRLNQLEETDKYRLPTEAQWEYAARAGTTTPFHTGSCLSSEQANYDGNYPQPGCPKGGFRQTTVRVGSFSPNAWGLHDMHGNVWEWVQDWKGDYPSGSVTDPEGPSSGSRRVNRGGSWDKIARYCRSAVRGNRDYPSKIYLYLGFRLLRTR